MLAIMAWPSSKLFAQAPAIGYSTPQTYAAGTAIAALTPANTGGVVAAPQFNTTFTNIYYSDSDNDAGLAMDKAGNIYIAHTQAANVLVVTPGSTSPAVFATGFSSVDQVAVDAAGNVYVTDPSGASLWKIPAGGGTAVAMGSFTDPLGVAIDAAGNIYVGDGQTGVYKMAPDGTAQTNISSTPASFLSVDLNGNLFFVNGEGNVYEIPVGGVQKAFYNAVHEIVALTTDASGNVYLAVEKESSIYMLPAGGGAMIQVGPSFSASATGLLLDANYNLYYTHQGLFKINATGGYFVSPELPNGLNIDPTSGAISGTPTAVSAAANYTVTAFNATGPGTATVNIAVGQAPAISYSTPQTYSQYAPITALTPANTGGIVGAAGFSPNAATPGTGISDANCVTIGTDGKCYIGQSSGKVSVFTPGGGPATVYKTGFGPVTGICTDQSNNVYLADGSFIWEIPAGGGTASKVGSFSQPTGVTIDTDNNLYVIDNDPNRGGVIELFSNRTETEIRSYSTSIAGIAVDANGLLYVADNVAQTFYTINGGNGDHTISSSVIPEAVTIDPAGNVYALMTSGLYMMPVGSSGLSLVGSGAAFNATGMVVDANFNLYQAHGALTETHPNGGYFIKPALLQGLTFDMNSGQISGTPGVISANNNYTVTTFNAFGNSSAPLAITIDALPGPAISYYGNPTFVQGTAISPWSPSSTGGTVLAPAFNSSATTVWSSGDLAFGLAMDKAGNLYIGDYTAKEVLKLSKGSSSPAVFATGFSSVAGIAVDPSGNVYAADPTGDKLWKIPAGGGTAIALGSFNVPYGVAVDAAGNVYVADKQSGVYKMAPDGTGQTSISSTGSNFVTADLNGNLFFTDFSGNVDEIPAEGAQKVFSHVGGLFLAITTDASGNVYVIRMNVIYMLPAGGGAPIQVGPSIISKGAGGLLVDAAYNLYWMIGGLQKTNATGGYFISPELPAGLTINPTGGTVTGTPAVGAPYTNYTVTAFNTTGSGTANLPMTVSPLPPLISYSTPQTYNVATAITTLTPNSSGGAVAAPAYNTRATYICIRRGEVDRGLAMDNAGNIYVADVSGRVILAVAPGASTATVFNGGYGSVNGIAVDASANVYVADAIGASLWKIPAGGTAPKFTLGSFVRPAGVAIDAAGNVYVADNSLGVYKMAADGSGQTSISSTEAIYVSVDLYGNVFFADESGNIYEIPVGGAQKLFYSAPGSLRAFQTDASGNVYYGYINNSGIYMLPAAGGTPLQVSSVAASINPFGLMFDAANNLYVASAGVNKANALGGYYASPELPAGITIDPTSGVISGTPAVTAPAANYTITAFNAAASATATVNIAVNPAAPIISYSTPQNFTAGAAIGALTPASTGGAVAAPGFNTSETTLVTGLGNGYFPTAIDKAGNIYIGNSGGIIYELAPGSSTPSVFASGFGVPEGLAVDASGNVFLADGTNQVLRKIPAGGGSSITLGSFAAPRSVATDAAGNIYVVDSPSGVYKMAPDGTGQTRISSTEANFITVDMNGNVFFDGLAAAGVYEIPTGGVQKVAFTTPSNIQSLTTDASGNVYALSGAGIGYVYLLPAGGGAPMQFLLPNSSKNGKGLSVDAGFNLYWTYDGALYKTNATGGYFASPELPNGLTIDPTSGAISGTPAATSAPTNYTITAFNTGGSGTAALNVGVNVALPAINYSTPQTYTTGTAITPLTPASTGGPVAAPQLNTAVTTLATGLSSFPAATAMDKAGNIYLSVQGQYNTPASTIVMLAPGSSTPTAFASGFYEVNQMATDAAGNVYVADPQSALWKIPAGGGAKVSLGSFTAPNGVAVDAAGNIYVADGFTGVYKMAPDGTGQTNLSSTRAGFVAVDLNGNVFFTNLGQLYEIPAGGTQKLIYTTPIQKGRFWSLTVDASGNVYFWSSARFITMLPAGGGSPVNVFQVSAITTGLIVDANFNLYWSNSGSLSKTNAAGGYFVSPELPAGLSIDPTSGIISGTPGPTAASAATNYTITAFNAAGPATATVNIAVNLAPPVISYSTPQTYTTGTAITPLMPASTGGAVAAPGFSASATALSAATTDTYTALAMDQAGNIYVGDNTSKQVLKLAPGNSTPGVFANGFGSVDGLAVDASGNVYVADAAGASVWQIPAGGGTAVSLGSFTAPKGVALDAAGNIYVTNGLTGVYKMAPDGSGQMSISSIGSTAISVDLNGNVFFANLNFIYELPVGGVQKTFYNSPDNVQSLTTDASGNVYFTTNAGHIYMLPAGGGAAVQVGTTSNGLMVDAGLNLYFTNQGVFKTNAVGGYFVSPELPAGLSIDPTSGAISGTPAANTAAANYTVTAFNVDGSATATINIGVSLSAPAISYSTPDTYLLGAAITPLAPANTGGAVGGAGFSGQSAVATGISDANCVAFDQGGNMYIGENGQVSELYNGTNTAVPIATGFNQVSAIAVDAAENVYVTDGSVWKIPTGGGPTLGLGTWGLAQGIAVDAANNIYVADVVNGVYRMAADGSKKTRIDNTPAASIAADMNGNLIFSASNGAAIYEIPKGGSRQSVPINGAAALTADRSGNFYVLDNFGALNIIYPGGATAANLPNIFGGSFITGMATDTHFNLYDVAGSVNEMTPTGGYFVSPELPKGLNLDPAGGTISGTPPAASPATNYTVSAFNAAGGGIATVNIKVAPLTAGLSALTLSAGVKNPGFTVANTSYTATVGYGASSITVTPTAIDPGATMLVDGSDAVASGTASSPIALVVGPNTITVKVTAPDGTTTETYTVIVTRAASVNLYKLGPNVGGLTPDFSPGTTSYTIAADNAKASMTLTPVSSDANATIKVNGMTVTSGKATAPIALAEGAQTVISTVVTAQDGATTKTYTLTVTRAPSTNAALSKLGPGIGGLTPAFSSTNTSYTISTGNATASMKLTPVSSDANATIQINGTTVASGATTAPIALAVGPNTITAVVTAQDGTTIKTYTLTVTRASGGADSYVPIAIGTGISVTIPIAIGTTETPALADDGVQVHQGVSPNGDGINDFLQIDNISQYPDNKLMIMNRNGQLVFETRGYDNSSKVFDGRSSKNGQMQLPGTYFYQLDYTVNGVTKHKTGFIMLKY